MGTAFFSGPQSPRNSSYSILPPMQRLKSILVIERRSPKQVMLGFTYGFFMQRPPTINLA
jgi:hypothetical protein